MENLFAYFEDSAAKIQNRVASKNLSLAKHKLIRET